MIIDKIKKLISEKKLLVHFDSNQPVNIQYDASKDAIAWGLRLDCRIMIM